MAYIDQALLDNETIIKKGEIHWFVYVRGVFIFILGIYVSTWGPWDNSGTSDFFSKVFTYTGIIIILFSILILYDAFVYFIGTELAITTKRIVVKFGFISRDVNLNLSFDKVESILVNQSITGRLFNFGTIIVNGIGGKTSYVPRIKYPLDIKNRIYSILEQN